MKIRKIALYHLRTPLRIQFAQANQKTQQADSVIVRLETAKGNSGYGEACPRTYVTGESASTLIETLRREGKDILAAPFSSLTDIEQWSAHQLSEGQGPALVCALELALLDAWSKEYQRDLKKELGGQRNQSEISYSGVLPFGKWSSLKPIVASFQFKTWKFKAAARTPDNVQRISELRSVVGDGTPIRMDANGGWSYEQAREQIGAAIQQNIYAVEQPLAAGEDHQSAALLEEFGADVRIMADESLCTFEDAQRLIASKACNHFSLKLSKNGGIFSALRIYRLALENGLLCQMSAHYGETSILSAAGLLFASVASELTACEGALGTFLLREDLTKNPIMVDQSGIVPGAELSYVGWPVTVDELSLNRNSVRTEAWEI